MATTVHRYGTPFWFQLPEVAFDQLRLSRELSNKLVELSRQHDVDRIAAYLQYPEVADAHARMDECITRVNDATIAVNRLKVDQRTRAPKGPETQELRAAHDASREARLALKAAIAARKSDAKPQERKLTEQYQLNMKALYALFVQQRGLYWAVFNDVLDHHKKADDWVIKQRMKGRTAERRFQRFTGAGSLAVQLQRGADVPARTPEHLAGAKSRWRNVLRLDTWIPPDEWNGMTRAEQRRKARSTITLRIGDQQVAVPAIMHRMLSPDADVTGGRLVVRRMADAYRVSVHVSAKVPDPKPRETGPRIAVHCGWRHESASDTIPEGIRVATWRTSEPVDVPTNCNDIVFATGPMTGIVLLPETWRAGLHRPDERRSARDLLLNPVRDHLVEWFQQHPDYRDDEHPVTDVAKWRSPHRFAMLARQWQTEPPPDGAHMAAELEQWRLTDMRMWRSQEHGRTKHLERRLDAWRRVGAWLATIAGEVIVDDTDLAELTRVVTADMREDATPSEVTAVAARQRTDAAAGDLRAAIKAAATREGVTVSTVPALNLSREHTCGYVNPAPESRPVRCEGCGRYYDPDESATLLMCLREPLPVKEPRPKRPRKRAKEATS